MEDMPIIYPKMRYQLVHARSIGELETRVEELMQRGWQPHGTLFILEPKPTIMDIVEMGHYYREMVYVDTTPAEKDSEEQSENDREAKFKEALEKMPQRIHDILGINGVQFEFVGGMPYTRLKGKLVAGIDPQAIVGFMKDDGYYPIDLADQDVLDAVGMLVICAS